MSAYIYKNLLIIDRNCVNDVMMKLIAWKNWGLPQPKPFEYRSPNDKVILCYSGDLTTQAGPHIVSYPFSIPQWAQEGAIHILLDGTDIKVSRCLFPDVTNAPKNLTVLKQYLEQSVPSAITLTLHWSPHLVNDNTRGILTTAGLLTDLSNLTHKITKRKHVSFAFGTKPSQPATFGSQNSSSFFGHNFGGQEPKSAFGGSFWK
jgi:hypothetical protein